MDYDKSIKEAREKIKEHAYYMKMALDAQNLKDAMKKAKLMLSQLKIGNVSPRDYYMLFMEVFDELQLLEEAFRDEAQRKKKKFSKIYEKVQYSDEIIPRLYLMVTAGSVLMDTEEITASAVINDLTGMLKGVQHPFRGLFLRYYFLKVVKDKIPDGDDEENAERLEKEFGSLDTIIGMLLENLTEMNKLWIRTNSLIKDKKRRKKERGDLKVTVGENIVRLSGIESITLDIYKEKVLPPLLEHICETGDKISQQYLMDCIIHAFPDEYHISTLDMFLTATENLNKKVDLRLIYIKLMERFADYSKNYDDEEESEIGNISDMHFIYEKFRNSIKNVIEKLEADDKLRLDKLLELLAAFINFCVHTYPDKIEYVDQILELSISLCTKITPESYSEKELDNIVSILTYPLETMSIVVLNLSNYPQLMRLLPFDRKKLVSVKIIEAVLKTRTVFISEEILGRFIEFIEPLLVLQEDAVKTTAKELQAEQTLVAKLIHNVQCHDPAVTFKMLKLFEAKFVAGPIEWKKFTIPSLVTNYLRYAQRVIQFDQFVADEKVTVEEELERLYDYRGKAPYLSEEQKEQLSFKVEKIERNFAELFENLFNLIEENSLDYPESSLRLYLDLALIVNQADNDEKQFDELQYDICSEALELYQDEISDTKEKKFHLQYILGTLMNITNLTEDNLDSLMRNASSYASSMLKKSNKVAMLCKATHLFNSKACEDEDKVKMFIAKALKYARNSTRRKPNTAYVYINVLDKIIYYYNKGLETIQVGEINQCIKIIKEKMEAVSPDVKEMMTLSMSRISAYIAQKKQDDEERFKEIEV